MVLNKKILIWDLPAPLPVCDCKIILWSKFEQTENDDSVSIPKFIEENDLLLKESYLSWIYELGETKINQKSLIEYLKIRNGLSYWWMTGIAQKKEAFTSPPEITDTIKLFALVNIIESETISEIIIATENKSLQRTVRLLSKRSKYKFRLYTFKNEKKAGSLSNPRINIPSVIKAMVWFSVYLSKRLIFTQKKHSITSTEKEITFFNYFDNINKLYLKKDEFFSSYWTSLPEFLSCLDLRKEWVHIYIEDSMFPSAQKAIDAKHAFQRNSKNDNTHKFIEENLSFDVVVKTLRDYFIIILFGLRLYKIKNCFNTKKATLNLWYMFSTIWYDSFFGISALSNCLYLNLFEKLLKNKTHKPIGLFLQENQAWEIALIYAWRTYGHGKLIGVPHSTIRFWDLRYFIDSRSLISFDALNAFPRADIIAVNGKAAYNSLVQFHYPVNELIEVEALRYLNLTQQSISGTTHINANEPFRILILGDYLLSETIRQIQWIEEATNNYTGQIEIFIKPHPNCPINISDYKKLNLILVDSPINELFIRFNVAYTSNSTSAAIDMYLLTIPVISVLDPEKLNMSPLKGVADVYFVSSPKELQTSISIIRDNLQTTKSINYFNLDVSLNRWKSLITNQLID